MSEIFEGIVSPAQSTNFALVRGRELGLELETQDLGEGLAATYRADSRHQAAFSPVMHQLAADVSRRYGEALLALFDSRVGSRFSALFENGQQKQSFGEADELYVPLDESGNPVDDAIPLALANLDPNVEYETTANAIQLGLRAFGRGRWSELYRVITTI